MAARHRSRRGARRVRARTRRDPRTADDRRRIPADEALVRQLGADEFIARTEDLGAAVRRVLPRGVDGALDAALVGMPALDAVRDGGSFVAVSAGAAPSPLRGTRVHNVWIRTDAPGLAELAALVDAGRLTPRVASTERLEAVAAAHERSPRGAFAAGSCSSSAIDPVA